MAHNINILVFKKEEALELLKNIPHVDAQQGFVLVPITENLEIKDVVNRISSGNLALVETSYFGGVGDQNAECFVSHQNVPLKDADHPINEALRNIGVVRSDKNDEFDAISLGSYRSNNDIVSEWRFKTASPIKTSDNYRIFLLKNVPEHLVKHKTSDSRRYYMDSQTFYFELYDFLDETRNGFFKVENKVEPNKGFVQINQTYTGVSQIEYDEAMKSSENVVEVVIYNHESYLIKEYKKLVLGFVKHTETPDPDFMKYVIQELNSDFAEELNFATT